MGPYFHLTYDECRMRFRALARRADARLDRYPIAARGPEGQTLTIDMAQLGSERPARTLVLQSGTHGVEGFAGSAIQQQFLAEDAAELRLPDDGAVILVHAVNPYGFAWWRRQNENNVDLNRNFVDHERHDIKRPEYVALNPLLCPVELTPETDEAFLAAANRIVEEHGFAYAARIVSEGQWECPDGLYYGGTQPEESNRIIRDLFAGRVSDSKEAVLIDLHTGLGEFGTYTLLSNHAEDSPEHAYVTQHFDAAHVHTTVDGASTVTAEKAGQLARGVKAQIPAVDYRAITFELGTFDEFRVVMAERRENWLHHYGDRDAPEAWDILWEHRVCSCPDSREWEAQALAHGRTVIGQALTALFPEA